MSAMAIPEGWELYSVDEIANYVNGKAHEANINEQGKYVVVNSRFISTESEIKKYSDDCYCPASTGDVLMVMSDVPNGRAIAKCFYVPSDDTYTVNQRICILTPKDIDGKLLFYKLNRNQHYLAFDDGAKQTNLRKEDVLSCMVTLPVSRAEQHAIAVALTDMDALISSLNQLITKKRDIQQAAMQQLLTGQRRLPGFSGEWEVKRLGKLATFMKGQGLSKNDLVVDGARPCIHYGELFTHYSVTIQEVTSRTNNELVGCLSKENDVLMPTSDVTPRGLAKASCLSLKDVVLGGDILVIRPNPNSVNGSFLSYVIRHDEDQVLKLVTGSTVFHLYGADMKKFELMIPSIEEQNAIAAILADMDIELATLEARRDKARQIKQGMMQELLTGRIRLV